MSEHIRKTMEEVQRQVRELEDEVARKKRMVNDLAELAGAPPVYASVQNNDEPSISSIRRDQWYGQPLSTAIREYLEMRRGANLGPATVNEIFDALTEGGYNFETKNDDNAKRGLRISLTKNTSIFHRVGKKHYGLLEWYPEVKERKKKGSDSDDGEAMDGGVADPNGDAEQEKESNNAPSDKTGE